MVQRLRPTLNAECDFLIVGGGVIGISIARSLLSRNSHAKIIIIEKELASAFHASGRNSGVLHAGFYYTADSLKARFTREGCLRLKEYCRENSLPINNCGKLVVAQTDEDLPQIDELLNRARQNSVELHEVNAQEAFDLEPNVKFHERVLWSPQTSVVDPKCVVQHMAADLLSKGVRILFNTAYVRRESSNQVATTAGSIRFSYFINCAGLYADKVAADFGFSKKFRLLAFKGVYLKSTKALPSFLKRHVYPVPNLKNPFLGVHFTITIDGRVKIGPTAIPAFWREQYAGLEGFALSEFIELVVQGFGLCWNAEFDFLSLAIEEFKKYSKSYLRSQARNLVQKMDDKEFHEWGPSGIRAQLLNTETKKLEMDYVFEGDKDSFHVLNAVSPAFTSSLPFSEFICDQIFTLLDR